MNLNDALEAYLRDLGKSEMTLYTYGKDAGQIVAYFGNRPLNNLSRLTIGKFLKSPDLLEMKGGKARAPHTVNKTRGFLKRFIRLCLKQGYLRENPLPKELAERKNGMCQGGHMNKQDTGIANDPVVR